jgi:hypothetical protein
MGFSMFVEMLNLRATKTRTAAANPVVLRGPTLDEVEEGAQG